jgi:hypothetical protein
MITQTSSFVRRLAAILIALAASSVLAQSTAFTYQGKLNNGGAPITAPYDFRFTLFNAASGGTQIGSPQCVDNVPVAAGLFTTTLDFGQQFTTAEDRFLQIEVRADPGLTCANPAGLILLGPRQPLTAAPIANHAKSAFSLAAPDGSPANAVFVDNDGSVGIGTTTPGTAAPGTKLEVVGGPILAANSGDQADLLWLASERSWVFRQEGTGAAAALKLQSIGGGGNKSFIVQTTGNVGIGTTTPTFKLDVSGNMRASDAQFADISAGNISAGISEFQGISSTGVLVGRQQSSNGVAVLGTCGSSFNTAAIGVRGVSLAGDANSFGVFAAGRLGATGTKSFRIDHPENPANQYLFHYSAESPEVINFYRGMVRLDAHGHAAVQLPSYFAKINTNPSYHLTPVGSAMPTIHISTEINEQALSAGALAGPNTPSPRCWFEIAGGVPGGKVSWRVEAARNDEFVRRNGAPVEVEKPNHERGTTEFTRTTGTLNR